MVDRNAESGKRRARRAAPAGAALAALLLAALVALEGCGSARPPALAPAAAPEARDLLAALTSRPEPAAMEGRGLLRIEAGDRRAPALQARFALQRAAGAQLGLRPGAFSPVLSLWVGERAWSLRLPRQRVAFESSVDLQLHLSGDTLRERSGESLLTAAVLRDLAWFLFHPAALAERMEIEGIGRGPSGWVMRGRLEQNLAPACRAEIWTTPEGRAVTLWALQDSAGRSILRVGYEPPFEAGRSDGQISFICNPLDVKGDLVFEGLRPASAGVPARPPLPAGWQLAPVEEIASWIEGLADPE